MQTNKNTATWYYSPMLYASEAFLGPKTPIMRCYLDPGLGFLFSYKQGQSRVSLSGSMQDLLSMSGPSRIHTVQYLPTWKVSFKQKGSVLGVSHVSSKPGLMVNPLQSGAKSEKLSNCTIQSRTAFMIKAMYLRR